MTNFNLKLSLVLPAYNESRRLPPYLASIRGYLDGKYGSGYEVIVVDDGSTDDLHAAVKARMGDWPQLRYLRHPRNLGKGAAVRSAVLASCGDMVLFADADGAAPIGEEGRLAAAIDAGADIAVGSRLLPDPEKRRTRPWNRRLAGRLFAALAGRLLRLKVADTQCGFKMFRGDVARRLFGLVRESGFLFDVEVLLLAQRMGCRCAEVGIDWNEQRGGHFRLIRNGLPMIMGLWSLYLREIRGSDACDRRDER